MHITFDIRLGSNVYQSSFQSYNNVSDYYLEMNNKYVPSWPSWWPLIYHPFFEMFLLQPQVCSHLTSFGSEVGKNACVNATALSCEIMQSDDYSRLMVSCSLTGIMWITQLMAELRYLIFMKSYKSDLVNLKKNTFE